MKLLTSQMIRTTRITMTSARSMLMPLPPTPLALT